MSVHDDEAAVLRVDLQQTTDGLGLQPNLLGHALGGSSRRSSQGLVVRLSTYGIALSRSISGQVVNPTPALSPGGDGLLGQIEPF